MPEKKATTCEMPMLNEIANQRHRKKVHINIKREIKSSEKNKMHRHLKQRATSKERRPSEAPNAGARLTVASTAASHEPRLQCQEGYQDAPAVITDATGILENVRPDFMCLLA